MAPVVDMSDKNAWDDSLLIDSWDSAVNEYKVRLREPPFRDLWRISTEQNRNITASTNRVRSSKTS